MTDFGILAERYSAVFRGRESDQLVANVRTRMELAGPAGGRVPITINDVEELHPNSYVCSPRTLYEHYAKEELCLIRSQSARWALSGLASGLGALLRAAAFDRTVHVNNWLLSTNLYPDSTQLAGRDLRLLHEELVEAYPDHYIAFRSLNPWSNAGLIRELKTLGYRFLGSRQVYVFEAETAAHSRAANRSHDRRLLKKTPYHRVPHESLCAEDFARMADLYRQLYVQKYSTHNPQFTAEYLRACHRDGIMRFVGLRSAEGRLDGILGLFVIGDTVTAPIVGYELSIDRRFGLYRLLMALVFEVSAENGWRVNLSSGAAHFKRLRGGVPVVEYTAIHSNHLSAARRAALSALIVPVNGIGIPLMRWLRL